MAKPLTIDVLIAVPEQEAVTADWWANRFRRADTRAGGLPPEVADPLKTTVEQQVDPNTGEQFACIRFHLPAETTVPRANELAHLLTSVFIAEGHTLRQGGKRLEIIPGAGAQEPTGEFGGTGYTEARVCSGLCLGCALSSDTKIACCGEGAAVSLADIGATLLAGDEEMAARWLSLPGEMDGEKWHPHLAGGVCVFHDPSRGCTLPQERMPLQCRTYVCYPEKLLPPELFVEYNGYVDALEEAEDFISEHMRLESGVDFGSPLPDLKEAARKAFAAWESGRS